MKHGSYTELKILDNHIIGYNSKGIQPYVVWDRTPDGVDNAVFCSSCDEAKAYIEWREHGENENRDVGDNRIFE